MAIFNSYVCLPEVSSPVKSLDRSRAPWRQAASAPWAPRGNASSWACSARNPTAPHSFPWKCLKCPKDGTNRKDTKDCHKVCHTETKGWTKEIKDSMKDAKDTKDFALGGDTADGHNRKRGCQRRRAGSQVELIQSCQKSHF